MLGLASFEFSSANCNAAQVGNTEREPYTTPTIPPDDQDTRWIYSSGKPFQPWSSASTPEPRLRSPTNTFSMFPLESKPPPSAATTPTVAHERGGYTPGGERGSSKARRAGLEKATALMTITGDTTEEQQPHSRTSPGEQSRRQFNNTWGARMCSANQRPEPLRVADTSGKAAEYGLSLKLLRSRGLLANERMPVGSYASSSNRSLDAGAPPTLSSCANSPSVSPWCRQVASPAGWDSGGGGEAVEVEERGVVSWNDEAAGVDVQSAVPPSPICF